MKSFFITLLIVSISLTSIAQEDQVKNLVASIKSYKETARLNEFLQKQKLIPYNKNDSEFHFHPDKIKVDVFRKNLFGNAQNEVVIQLREEGSYAVNVFYYEQQQLKKVPGQLIEYAGTGGGYYDHSYVFSFENIFAEEEFCILAKQKQTYNRSTTSLVELYKITKDSIISAYSFDDNSSTYSGVFSYEYYTSCEYSFLLENNKYPKKIHKKVNFRNMNQNENCSYVIEGSYLEVVSLDNLIAKEKKFNELKRFKYFIRSIQELKYVNNNVKLDTNVTLFLKESFLRFYLPDNYEISGLIEQDDLHDEENNYLPCRDAWMKNGQLFILPLSTNGAQSTLLTYALKPQLRTILKKEINPKRMFYLADHSDNNKTGKIIFSSKDSVIVPTSQLSIVSFSDTTAIIYEVYRNDKKEVCIYVQGEDYSTGISIPISSIASYIKPELLYEFENCCKE